MDLDPEEIEQGYKTDDVKKFWTKFDKEGKVIGKNCSSIIRMVTKDITSLLFGRTQQVNTIPTFSK